MLDAEAAFDHFLPTSRPSDGCWEWRGTIATVGYGQLVLAGVHVYAHRLSWELDHGRKLPDGVQVRHSCDNRLCVNPAHLSAGSFYDNMQDAIDRDRFQHSDSHWNAKLTPDDVRTIRVLYAGGMSQRAIGDQYGVDRRTIGNITRGRNWNHVV